MGLLTTRDLTLSIAGKILCTDVNVDFNVGENWVVLGANGSGKTTLLHTLAGLRSPTAGEVLLQGQPIQQYPARERAKKIGLLFQDYETAFPATVRETAMTGRHPHLGRWQWEQDSDQAQATEALSATGVLELATRLVNTLSGGERRRVEIATLLTQNAPIGLYDEPTNHLDLRHQEEILNLLADRAKAPGRLNVFVLHDVNLAVRLATHALLLFGDGAWIAGELQTILDTPTLEQIYGCRLRVLNDGDKRYYLPA